VRLSFAADWVLAAGLCMTAPTAVAQMQPPAKRILVVPPLQWDAMLSSFHAALHQTIADFTALTGGIAFGMAPSEVNDTLSEHADTVDWQSLSKADEFPDDVRYFWIPLARSGALRDGIAGCAGSGSYVVFLFRRQGLFRISYRLTPDQSCRDVSAAASDIFARYVGIDPTVALAVHYRTGSADVIDVTDPAVSYLIPVRWQNHAK
jgi:hypothetical protein